MSWMNEFATSLVTEYDAVLLDHGPEEQHQFVVAALQRFQRHTPLRPYVEPVNVFGFATAQTCLASDPSTPEGVFLRLLPLAESVGISPKKAIDWIEREQADALRDQRAMDEKRGRLGWEHLGLYASLDLVLCLDDETAEPDMGGQRWTFASEWLISLDRLMALMLASPWRREFMDNTRPLMAHAFDRSGLSDLIGGLQAVEKREAPDGGTEWAQSDLTLADVFEGEREGLSEEEARRRAFSGPTGTFDDGEELR